MELPGEFIDSKAEHEAWSISLREECRLMRAGGPTREKVVGGRRKLHNQQLLNLYSLQNIINVIKSRTVRSAGHVERMG